MRVTLRQIFGILALFGFVTLISRAQPLYAGRSATEREGTSDSTDSVPDTASDTLTADTTSSDTASADTTPSDTASADTASSDTASADTMPRDTGLSDSVSDSTTDTSTGATDETVPPADTTSHADTAPIPPGRPASDSVPSSTVSIDTATAQRDTSATDSSTTDTSATEAPEPELTPREEAEKHYRVAMEYANDDSKSTEMIGELTLAVQADPEYAPPHLALGIYNFRRKDYKSAEGDLKKAAELAPGDTTVLDNLGKLYLALRKRDEAEKVFVSAVEANKNFMTAYRQLGDLYYREKRYNDAISALKTFTAKVNDDPTAHLRIGKAYRKLGKYDKAIEAYQAALSIKEDYAPAYSALGQIYLAQEKFAEAVDAYGKSVKYNPKAYRSYFNLAIATQSAQPDSLKQSLAAWRLALKMARNNPRVTDIVPIAENQIKELAKQIELRSKN